MGNQRKVGAPDGTRNCRRMGHGTFKLVLVLAMCLPMSTVSMSTEYLSSGLEQPAYHTVPITTVPAEDSPQTGEAFVEAVRAVQSHHRGHMSDANVVLLETESETARAKPANASPGLTFDIPIFNYRDQHFIGRISVGTPPQDMDVIFDTASPHFWIYSSDCVDHACLKAKRFVQQASSSVEDTGALTGSIKYGMYELQGEILKDKLAVGFTGLGVPSQPFVAVRNVTGSSFYATVYDGVFGLGMPASSSMDLLPPFDVMMRQGIMDCHCRFAIYLSRDHGQLHGAITFGGFDTSFYSGPMYTMNVKSSTHWMVRMNDVHLDGTGLNVCGAKGCKVILDSGSSFITVPSKIFKNSPLGGLDVLPDCSNMNQLPTLAFRFENILFNLTAEEYVAQIKTSNGKTQCVIGILPMDIPEPIGPTFSFGTIFMKAYYTMYDRGLGTVGFAKAADTSLFEKMDQQGAARSKTATSSDDNNDQILKKTTTLAEKGPGGGGAPASAKKTYNKNYEECSCGSWSPGLPTNYKLDKE